MSERRYKNNQVFNIGETLMLISLHFTEQLPHIDFIECSQHGTCILRIL